MTVRAILKGKGAAVVTAVPGETLHRIAQLIAEYRIGAVLILDMEGHPVGIVSERDIVSALAAWAATRGRARRGRTRVKSIPFHVSDIAWARGVFPTLLV